MSVLVIGIHTLFLLLFDVRIALKNLQIKKDDIE